MTIQQEKTREEKTQEESSPSTPAPSGLRPTSLPMIFGLVCLLLLPVGVWALAAQTSARFSALIPVGRARLVVGSVDIDVELSDRSDLTLTATNVAPGDEVYGAITTSNVGGLAVRYRVQAGLSGQLPDEWVTVETWTPGSGATVQDCGEGPTVTPSAEPAGPLESIPSDQLSFLPPRTSAVTCLVLRLARSAPNEAQARSLDVVVVVDAIQASEEPPTSFRPTGSQPTSEDGDE